MIDGEENVVLAGTFDTTIDFGGDKLVAGSRTDIFLAKLGKNGEHIWSRRFGGAYGQSQSSISPWTKREQSMRPLLAAATLAALGGYRALAVASALTVLAYAVDVIAGSPLTSLSLLGPNPGLGVRFYGIGNELEALLAVLVVAGTGAALTGFAPARLAAASVAAFLAHRARLGLCLRRRPLRRRRRRRDRPPARAPPSPRRSSAGGRRRALLLALAAPLAAVALLALVDLLSGADAHLTRSVLDAGGLDQLAEVAQRRLQLSAHSFARPIVFVFLPLLAAVAVLALSSSATGSPPGSSGPPAMRAGLAGALAATIARHPGERLRRPAAGDRHRLPAGLRRLRLGRGGRLTRPLPLGVRANRPCLAIFLVLSGRREPAR